MDSKLRCAFEMPLENDKAVSTSPTCRAMGRCEWTVSFLMHIPLAEIIL